MKKQALSAERLRELLDYDPSTGVFTWRDRDGSGGQNQRRSRVAGSVYSNGYLNITIDYRAYGAARLAFLWVKGRWPSQLMDHINRDPLDNRWINLREATPKQNLANSFNSNNKLGLKGVCYEVNRRKFKAYIQVSGKSINLGRFDTAKEAQAAYAAAAEKYFGKFARVNTS